MSVRHRNNVHVAGAGPATMVFAHGFGCDQAMWRLLAPAYAWRYRTIVYDLVGSGGSDLSAYDRGKYGSLHGHADDLLEIIESCAAGPVIFVGHSVGAMIGLLAANQSPRHFLAQVMVAPSPCYVNDGDDDYVGGFNPADLQELLFGMDQDFLGWSQRMAPLIMGAPDRPELARELTRSFVRNDAAIARHFASVTFLADHRRDLPLSTVPALILECTDDLLVPREVGDYMLRHLPHSTLSRIDNIGHCPHLSAPTASSHAIDVFLAGILAREAANPPHPP